MNRERWETVKARFAEALELPPAERDSYLSRNCGQDEELRREVSSLLQAHAEEFLETPLELEAPEPAALSGRAIQNLRIGERIGTGGLGEVYAAVDVLTGERIAVKRLAVPAPPDAKEVARFRQEARAAMALRHPNVVRVRGFVEWEGEFLIPMDMVEGKTLRETLNERRLSPPEAIGYAIPIADALAKAHELGIIHRDVKPENVMVTAEGIVKLLDFGIAKLVEPKNRDEAPTPDQQSLSREGVVLGSASYMSPEQIQAHPVDGRSDVFSLGALLYEMTTGRKAFDGATLLEVIASVLRDDPPLPGSGALDGILRKALSKDTEERFETMAAFRDALVEIKRGA